MAESGVMYVLRYTFSAKSSNATCISVGYGHPDHIMALFGTDCLWLVVPSTGDLPS